MGERQSTVRLTVADNFSQQLRAFATAIDKADKETAQLGRSAVQAGISAKQLSSGLGQIASGLGLAVGIAGVTAAVVALGKESIELGMKMEQTELAFKTLTGSTQEAQKHLDELKDFARQTPFQFEDLVQASRRMHAFGFETSQIVPMLRDIGDAAAAMGASSDTINRITLAIGQMSSKGKVSAQEMLQLTEAGIPAWKYLADAVGVTTAEVQKMTEKGLVPADVAIQALLKGMREDFGGQMAEQAKTAGGAWSNLVDVFNQLLTVMGERANPILTTVFNNLSDNIQSVLLFGEATEKGVLDNADLATIGWNNFTRNFGANVELMTNKIEAFDKANQDQNAHVLQFYKVQADQNSHVLEFYEAQNRELANNAIKRAYDDGNISLKTMVDLMADLEEGTLDAESAMASLDSALSESKLKQDLEDISLLLAGPVGKENEKYIEQQADLRLQIKDVREELQKYYDLQGKVVTLTDEAKVSTAEYQLAQYNASEAGFKLAEAQQKLAENTDPAKAIELEGAILRAQVAFEKASEKVGEYSELLGGQRDVTIDNSKTIGELETDLLDLETAYAENADAHEDATKRIIFNILQQRLASNGWKDEEIELLTTVGEQWGIFDKDTAAALRGTNDALKAFNEGDVNTTLVILNALWGGPVEKVYKVRVDYSGPQAGEIGIGPVGTPDPGLPGPGPVYDSGGNGGLGQQALGGEYMVSRPTTFVAGDMGAEKVTITPAGQEESKSGKTLIQNNTIYMNSPMDANVWLAKLAEKYREN